MGTASDVERIIAALAKSCKATPAATATARAGEDPSLLAMGVVAGILVVAVALLWRAAATDEA